MKQLLLRISELDQRVGDQLRVIAFFDALLQSGTGLDRLLLEAARLAECPVGVSVPAKGVHRRAGSSGAMLGGAAYGARSHPLPNGGEVWMERHGGELALDAMLLERLAISCATVLGGGTPSPALGDPALLELVFGAASGDLERSRALRLVGLAPDRPVQVAAVGGPGSERAQTAQALGGRTAPLDGLCGVLVSEVPWPDEHGGELPGTAPVGVGPRIPAARAADAWQMARTALRFAGPGLLWGRVVHWERLGGFAQLAEHLPDSVLAASPDTAALERLAEGGAGGPLLSTLDAYAASDSLRQTAARLFLHRSSVAARIARAERELGFGLHTPQGRSRLTLALTMYRLRTPGHGTDTPAV